ncbi:MAG: CHAT domain-containing protein, partial [Syntrophobacteraceae bacterium]
LASLYAATSRPEEALAMMLRAQGINDRLIRNVFTMASEKQRLAYLATLRSEMDSVLSLIAQYLGKSPAAVSAGLDLVLRRKAIVAEAMAAERDAVLGGQHPELEADLREMKTLRAQIAQKTMAGPGPEGLAAHRKTLSRWRAEEEKLELRLAGRIPEINLEKRLRDADRRAVAGALPEGAALVEFVRVAWYDFQAVRSRGQSSWQPAHYLAFVLLSGDPDNVRLLDLGPAAEIEKMIADFRRSITGVTDKPGGRGLTKVGDEKPRAEATADLYGRVLGPVVKVLGERKKLILSPDSGLYRLPFGAIPTEDGRRFIDEYQVSYVGAGRDVLRFGSPSSARQSLPIVTADPDYDLSLEAKEEQGGGNPGQGRQSRDLAVHAPHFERLPGTRSEGEHIAGMLDVKPRLEKLASKGQLKEAHSPRILHIATHGFFLPDQAPPGDREDRQDDTLKGAEDRRAGFLTRAMENPLLRSGLVLAGANAWLKGLRLPPEAGDGILTGEDASGLDLLSTDLVVLSACETGLGDIRVGEGVFGLRRAFLLAGAKTLVMSLWKVPDAQTQMLMEEFYRRILAGQPRAEALRGAQLKVKEIYPDPVYWGAFVCQGDPGTMPPVQRTE